MGWCCGISTTLISAASGCRRIRYRSRSSPSCSTRTHGSRISMAFIIPNITIMINKSSKRSTTSGLLRRHARDRRRSHGRWLECFAVLFLLSQICAAPILARAQQTPIPSASDLAPLKQLLDQIQQAIGHGGHTDQSLTELREKLAPIRDGLRDRFDVLDPRLAEVDSRLSQLGPAPAAGAPPEAPTIAEERAKLSQSRAEVDAALKETRLLSLRADDVAARINETRRTLFSRALFQRTPGALDARFWAEAARAARTEAQGLSFLLESWSNYARRNGGLRGAALSAVTIAIIVGLAFAVVYGWRRRFGAEVAPDRTARRFARALTALLVLVRHA